MNMQRKYVAFEPGKKHPALTVVTKHSTTTKTERGKTETISNYEIRDLKVLKQSMSDSEILSELKNILDTSVFGDLRFIISLTYYSESAAQMFERWGFQPKLIKAVDDGEMRYEDGIYYIPFKDLLKNVEMLWDDKSLRIPERIPEFKLLQKDEDLMRSFAMAIWYASRNG